MCRKPVGEGAKRTTTLIGAGGWTMEEGKTQRSLAHKGLRRHEEPRHRRPIAGKFHPSHARVAVGSAAVPRYSCGHGGGGRDSIFGPGDGAGGAPRPPPSLSVKRPLSRAGTVGPL